MISGKTPGMDMTMSLRIYIDRAGVDRTTLGFCDWTVHMALVWISKRNVPPLWIQIQFHLVSAFLFWLRYVSGELSFSFIKSSYCCGFLQGKLGWAQKRLFQVKTDRQGSLTVSRVSWYDWHIHSISCWSWNLVTGAIFFPTLHCLLRTEK